MVNQFGERKFIEKYEHYFEIVLFNNFNNERLYCEDEEYDKIILTFDRADYSGKRKVQRS